MKTRVINVKKEKFGRNVFGEVCIEKFLKLERETAIDQYIEMMNDIFSHKYKIEYTVDSSCFTTDEARKFFELTNRINQMYSDFCS